MKNIVDIWRITYIPESHGYGVIFPSKAPPFPIRNSVKGPMYYTYFRQQSLNQFTEFEYVTDV